MKNVATVAGALTIGIVGGSMFAAALVGQPRTSPLTTPTLSQPAAVQAPAPVVVGAGGPAVAEG